MDDMPPGASLEIYNKCPRQTDLKPLSDVGRRMSQMDHIMSMGFQIHRNDFAPADWENHVIWKMMLDEERASKAKQKAEMARIKAESKGF